MPFSLIDTKCYKVEALCACHFFRLQLKGVSGLQVDNLKQK